MSVYGADTDALDVLAARLSGSADHLDRIVGQLETATRSNSWLGPESASFSAEWAHRHRPAMLGASAFLRDLDVVVRRNAAEQRAASGVSTASTGTVLTPITLGGFAVGLNMLVASKEFKDVESGVSYAGDAATATEKSATRLRRVLRPGTRAAINIGKLAKFAKFAGGGASVAGGGLMVLSGISGIVDPKATTEDQVLGGIEVAGGVMAMAGGAAAIAVTAGVLSATGIGAPIGAALVAASLAISVGLEIYKNREAIGKWIDGAARDTARVAERAARATAKAVKRAGRRAKRFFKELGRKPKR